MVTTRKTPLPRRAHPRKDPAKQAASKKAPSRPARPRKRAAPGKAPPRLATRRTDFGAPIDGFLARQPAHLRVILEALRALVEEEVPEAVASLKWGMPCFTLDGVMMCMLGAHKAHVNLVLVGRASLFVDPAGRLEGEGGGRHLKLTSLAGLPRAAVRSWLRTSADWARRER
jgi:hypothetical protein